MALWWCLVGSSYASTVVDSTVALAFVVWSEFLTLADGNRCQLQPSCSRFARQAIGRFGVAGLPMVADRLVREVNFTSYPRMGLHHADPLSAHAIPQALLRCGRGRRAGADLCVSTEGAPR